MSQERFDGICLALDSGINKDNLIAFKKLYKKYLRYEGAVLFSKTPEIHLHCNCKEEL